MQTSCSGALAVINRWSHGLCEPSHGGGAQEAAGTLGIGLSVLKRVCRTIGLARWPYRKRQSLRNVIEQTKKYLVRNVRLYTSARVEVGVQGHGQHDQCMWSLG